MSNTAKKAVVGRASGKVVDFTAARGTKVQADMAGGQESDVPVKGTTSFKPKLPNPIDVAVGGRMRQLRVLRGMSQDRLGQQLGVTFQQVQKYEKGTNRISASRLADMARIFGVVPAVFFETDEAAPAATASTGETISLFNFAGGAEGLALNKAFVEIVDPNIRKKVLALVKALAADSVDID